MLTILGDSIIMNHEIFQILSLLTSYYVYLLQFHGLWLKSGSSWVRDKVLYCSQHSRRHKHHHICVSSSCSQVLQIICNGPRWHLHTEWVAFHKRNPGPKIQISWANSKQASLPHSERRQLHDSHDMVTLTYLVVYVTSCRNCSVSRDREIWHTQQECAGTPRATTDLPLQTIHSTHSWQNSNFHVDV